LGAAVYLYSARSPEISWLNPPLQGYVYTTDASGHDITPVGIFGPDEVCVGANLGIGY
jgi:hypothetical protein